MCPFCPLLKGPLLEAKIEFSEETQVINSNFACIITVSESVAT